MNKWGTRIIVVGEGPSPTDAAVSAANSVAEGITSNRRILHDYVQEMVMRNPEVGGRLSNAWIDAYVRDSDIGDQDKTKEPAEERITMSNFRLMLH